MEDILSILYPVERILSIEGLWKELCSYKAYGRYYAYGRLVKYVLSIEDLWNLLSPERISERTSIIKRLVEEILPIEGL